VQLQLEFATVSADRPLTAGLGIQPFNAVTEDVFVWSMESQRSANPLPPFNCVLEVFLLACFCLYCYFVLLAFLCWLQGCTTTGFAGANQLLSADSAAADRFLPGSADWLSTPGYISSVLYMVVTFLNFVR